MLTHERYAEIFEGNVDLTRAWKWDGTGADWVRTLSQLRRLELDCAVDLSGARYWLLRPWTVRASGASMRIGFAGAANALTHTQPPPTHTRHYVVERVGLLQHIGVHGAATGSIALDEELRTGAARELARHQLAPGKFVVLLPGARTFHKRWPPSYYAALAARLRRDGTPVLLLGHPADEPYLRAVNRALDDSLPHLLIPSLRRLAAVLHESRCVVATDTGLKHLAAAAGARVIALHGHSDPVQWGPWGAGHHVHYGRLACQPCHDHERCPLGTVACLAAISPAAVFDTIAQMPVNGS